MTYIAIIYPQPVTICENYFTSHFYTLVKLFPYTIRNSVILGGIELSSSVQILCKIMLNIHVFLSYEDVMIVARILRTTKLNTNP